MDNLLNQSIIEKVIIKRVAIYKAMDILSQPPFEDKFKKETLCQQNENTQKQNSEKCLNKPEKRIEPRQNVDTNETKTVNEQENLNTTTQIKSGIYKIINKVNGKYYVGSSQNIRNRWYRHKSNLNKNKHWNKYLQNAYNKYSINNFEYIIVESVSDISKLLEVEQRYLDECKNNPDNNYMIAYDATAPMRGRKAYWNVKGRPAWNKGLKTNIPAWNRGLKTSDETKCKLREKANQQFNEEFRKKHSEYCKSKEHSNKISQGKKDKTIFTFKNEKTGEIFTGCKYDWYIKYFGKCPCNFNRFITGNQKSIHGWILVK